MNNRVDIYGNKKNDVAVNKVYKTEDLTIFKFTKFNRNVAIRKEMIEQAKEGFINPVVVNEHMVVIDGQHRIEHAKIANVPIKYIIEPGLNEHDIVRMNTNQKPWALLNYIESYANQGLEEYATLLNFINRKFAGVTEVIVIASNRTSPTSSITKKVREGRFKFNDFKETLNFFNYYKKFIEETDTPKHSKICYAIFSMYRIKGFDGKRLIEKVLQKNFDKELRRKRYEITEGLSELIDIYNDKITEENPKFINYYIKNRGDLIIENELNDWAKKKATHEESPE